MKSCAITEKISRMSVLRLIAGLSRWFVGGLSEACRDGLPMRPSDAFNASVGYDASFGCVRYIQCVRRILPVDC